LAKLALKIFTMITNLVPLERSFLAINFIYDDNRNRMLVVKADKNAFIYMNYRAIERMGKKSWDNLTVDEEEELEDYLFNRMVNFG
jgi:hypothetical protein